MTFADLDLRPEPRKLRHFSWIGAAILLFGTLWHARNGATPSMPWLLGLAVFCGVLGTVAPTAMKPVYLALTLLTFPIGFVVNWVILVVIWLGVFTPVALWFRIRGRDALQRTLEPSRTTYWIPRAAARPRKQYLRQY
ncbi:MAG: hypothetical protein U1G08_03660 [Verrucomicrobiota bacterium]